MKYTHGGDRRQGSLTGPFPGDIGETGFIESGNRNKTPQLGTSRMSSKNRYSCNKSYEYDLAQVDTKTKEIDPEENGGGVKKVVGSGNTCPMEEEVEEYHIGALPR